jgi:hypothetical protein
VLARPFLCVRYRQIQPCVAARGLARGMHAASSCRYRVPVPTALATRNPPYASPRISAVPDVAPPIFFNSGFMVLQPSLDTFRDLQVPGVTQGSVHVGAASSRLERGAERWGALNNVLGRSRRRGRMR